jgi:acyl-CoA thioester hydrolase
MVSAIPLQVRPSDCDAFGHVNNAVYASFIQHALADTLAHLGFSMDWHRDGHAFWELRSLTIEYRRPAVFGDALTAHIWLEQPHQTHPTFGCEIKAATPEGSQQSVCRSRSVWNRVSRQSEERLLLPESFLARFPRDAGVLPRAFDLPADSPKYRTYYWDLNVMVSEVGPNGRVHPQAVYNWVQESVFRASEQAGWPTERRLAAGFLTFQTRHDTEFLAFPEAGDSLRIASRVIEVRRLRGTWLHHVHRLSDGELVVREYTTGVFLDLTGRPAAPPSEMMKDLQFG